LFVLQIFYKPQSNLLLSFALFSDFLFLSPKVLIIFQFHLTYIIAIQYLWMILMFSIENYLYSLYHQAHTNLNQLQVPKVPIKLQFHQLLTFFDQQFTSSFFQVVSHLAWNLQAQLFNLIKFLLLLQEDLLSTLTFLRVFLIQELCILYLL
jgi:hypothetical protein